MKPTFVTLLGAALAVGALLNSGCVTDEASSSSSSSSATKIMSAADMGTAPAGVNTVKMTIDGSGVNGNVSLNGVFVGYTPREVHLEVSPDGRLAYNVTIAVSYSAGAGRALGGAGVGAGPQGGSYTYVAGDRVPANLMIRGPNQKEESRNLAPFDTKPEAPSARRGN